MIFVIIYCFLITLFNETIIKQWTFCRFLCIIEVLFNGEQMKKIVLLLLCAFVLCACGVKSDLSRPNGPLRDYPVY